MPLVWVRHGKGLVHLRQTLCLDADRREFGPDGPELWVLWGPSGSGKSRYARSTGRGPSGSPLHPVVGRLWHPRYGHLDDFRGDCMRLTDLQRLLDWYPLWVEIKGGSLPMLATRYVITSNQHPADWYTRRRPPWDDPPGASGTSPRPMGEAPGVPPGAGDRDEKPSSLRWMAPID